MQKFKGSHHGCPPFMEDTDEIRFSPWFTRSTTKESTASLENHGTREAMVVPVSTASLFRVEFERPKPSLNVCRSGSHGVGTYSTCYSGSCGFAVGDPGDCSDSWWRRHEPLALNGGQPGPRRTASVGNTLDPQLPACRLKWQMMSTGALHFPSLKALGANNVHV